MIEARPSSDAIRAATAVVRALERPAVLVWKRYVEDEPCAVSVQVDPTAEPILVRSLLGSLGAAGDSLTPVEMEGFPGWAAVTAGAHPVGAVTLAVGPAPAALTPTADALAIARSVAVAVLAALGACSEQDRLRFILDNSVDVIALIGANGVSEYITPSVERVLGWSVAEMADFSAFELLHPDDRDRVAGAFAEALTHPGERSTGRFRLRRKDDTWAWLEARAMHTPDRDDVVVVSARDVTHEVEATATAEAEAARYRHLIDSSPQGVAIRQDGLFVFANDTAARLLGADRPDDLVGLPILQFTHESSGVITERTDALMRGEVVGPWETTLARLDGSPIDLELTSVPTTWNGRFAIQTIATDLTERRRSEALIAHAALHDTVSGLPNRHLLADRVDQAVRRARRTGERAALLFCDLDNFKVVNEALGHGVGDEVLIEAGRRLRSVVRETDTVARFGGDEFAVLTPDLATDDDVAVLVDRIHRTLAKPLIISGHTLRIGVSIGVVVVDGEHTRDELLRFAETALFAAKETGPGRWMAFDEALRFRASDHLRIQNDLYSALETGEGLDAHFQPEVELATGRIIGYESLIRWTTPDGSPLAPDRFLPVAASAGLLPRIGEFMVGRATDLLARTASDPHGVWIAVNASAEELVDPDFAARIVAALDATGVAPDRLCLEITEHSIMRDPHGVANALQPLRALGVAIAIDDFGTGYSSLSYLARFQPEYLKIDRAFTADLDGQSVNRSIVEGVLHLATSLGITTIAEGIETPEQAQILLELGCDIGQGWHFGRPQPAVTVGAAPGN